MAGTVLARDRPTAIGRRRSAIAKKKRAKKKSIVLGRAPLARQRIKTFFEIGEREGPRERKQRAAKLNLPALPKSVEADGLFRV
jgi:hypothetical protein